MTYQQFVAWCNERACDGCWGIRTILICKNIMHDMNQVPFWKREKVWKQNYKHDVVTLIVDPINKKIKEINNENSSYN